MKDVVDRNTVIAPQDPYIISGKNGVSELRVCKAGVKGCKNAVVDVKALAEKLTENLNNSGIEEEIISTSDGPVKKHQFFTMAIAGCPNCCSQPQIKDFGFSGQAEPVRGEAECIECMKCVEVCEEEGAVQIINGVPVFNMELCAKCGKCAKVCPTESIIIKNQGVRVMAGGMIGRHPQLAYTLSELSAKEHAFNIFQLCADFFKADKSKKRKLGAVINRLGIGEVIEKIKNAVFPKSTVI